MKGTPVNRGKAQKQTMPTAAPSGMQNRRPAAIKGDARAGKGVPGVGGGGSNAGAKRAPGLYNETSRFSGNRGTGAGKGAQANFKRS